MDQTPFNGDTEVVSTVAGSTTEWLVMIPYHKITNILDFAINSGVYTTACSSAQGEHERKRF